MQVLCPVCGAAVAAGNINLDRLLGKCERCNGVFDLSAQIGQAPSNGDPVARPRRLVAQPQGIRILEDAREESLATYRDAGTTALRFAVERRWYTPALFAAVVFCVFWDGFLVVWYGVAIAAKNAPLLMILFPVLHVAAGVAITYSTLCGFVNRTRITVEGGQLSVHHGPLPWPGNQAIAIESLRQLFCEEIVGSKGARSYRLSALLRTGEKNRLLSGLKEPDTALYLEELLEKRLGITDERVAGEYL
jgi:hypothetical protein